MEKQYLVMHALTSKLFITEYVQKGWTFFMTFFFWNSKIAAQKPAIWKTSHTVFFFVFFCFCQIATYILYFIIRVTVKKNINFYIMLNLTLESLSFPLSFFLVSLFSAFFKLSLRAWISRSVYNNNIMQTCKPKLNQYYIYNVLPGYSLPT